MHKCEESLIIVMPVLGPGDPEIGIDVGNMTSSTVFIWESRIGLRGGWFYVNFDNFHVCIEL